MNDIVIDTCTLKHADDPSSKFFEESVEFVNRFIQCQTLIVVDEGFHLDETQNRSYIGLEYLKHLTPGSLGFNLIVEIATNNRLTFVSNVVECRIKKNIEQLIRNKKDRIFLRVAYNSSDKYLASHDFKDYSKSKRKKLRKELGTNIITAKEANQYI